MNRISEVLALALVTAFSGCDTSERSADRNGHIDQSAAGLVVAKPVLPPSSNVKPPAPPEPPPEEPIPQRVLDAFEAATGLRDNWTTGNGVFIRPLKLVQLPFGPVLLTAKEVNGACHSCAGAIGVYYLTEKQGKFKVTGRWPQAVHGSEWGKPPIAWALTSRFTTYPAIYATGRTMAQGHETEFARIAELRPSGPAESDEIHISYDDSGYNEDNRQTCGAKGRISNIRKDHSFDVVVTGTVRAVDRYMKRNGRFVAAKKMRWELPCGYTTLGS